jgi:hypothetical protein
VAGKQQALSGIFLPVVVTAFATYSDCLKCLAAAIKIFHPIPSQGSRHYPARWAAQNSRIDSRNVQVSSY